MKTAKIDVAEIDNSQIGLLITEITETLGTSDSISKQKSMTRTITEYIGLMDVKSKYVDRFRSITEYLGLKDTWSRIKHIYRVFIEKLGEIPTVQWIINKIYPTHKYNEHPNKKIETYEE